MTNAYKQGFEDGKKRYKHRFLGWLFAYRASDNPYNHLTGRDKKLKADWHNGLLAGRKAFIKEKAND